MLASIPARTLNPIRSRRGIPRFSLFGKCSSGQRTAANRRYSITSSARASSLAGISRYYGAIATSVFNDLDYIFLAPNWKRLVPDQKPLGELRPGPTYMAGRSKPSSRINIKTFQVGQQTGSTVWPRYAQVTTLRCEPDRPTPPSIGSHASLNTAIASARVGA